MRRGIALGVPGSALVAGVALWAQVRRVSSAPLPHFEDGDPSGRYGDRSAPTIRISVLGDSTITGPGLAAPDQVWVARVADRLHRHVDLRSFAKGGSRVRDVLRDQAPRAVAHPPELFVLAVGANDVLHGTPGPAFRRDLAGVLELLRDVAPVVTCGIGDLSMVPRLPRSLKPIVARRCAALDRIHHRVTHDMHGVVRVPVAELADPFFRDATEHVWADDRFHPNHVGHAIWADAFGPSIRDAVDGATGIVPVLSLRCPTPMRSLRHS